LVRLGGVEVGVSSQFDAKNIADWRENDTRAVLSEAAENGLLPGG